MRSARVMLAMSVIQILAGHLGDLGHFFNNPVGPAPGQIRRGFSMRASVLFSKKSYSHPRVSPCLYISRRRRGPGIWPWGGSFLRAGPAVVGTPQGPWRYPQTALVPNFSIKK